MLSFGASAPMTAIDIEISPVAKVLQLHRLSCAVDLKDAIGVRE